MARIIETETRYAPQPDCKTAEEMTEICCESAVALPCCEEIDPEWEGFTEEEVLAALGIVLDAQGRDEQGRYVEIRFEPRDKPCGEKVTKYDLNKGNCCGDVPPLAWDSANSADILAQDSSAILFATGGMPPYTWRTTSNGTWFDDGRKTAVTLWPMVRIHGGPTFCGKTAVYVSDGCSTARGMLRSDVGHWLLRDSGTPATACGLLSGTVVDMENDFGDQEGSITVALADKMQISTFTLAATFDVNAKPTLAEACINASAMKAGLVSQFGECLAADFVYNLPAEITPCSGSPDKGALWIATWGLYLPYVEYESGTEYYEWFC